jgi:short subunit dehydrogenase-like uncharacterized protein
MLYGATGYSGRLIAELAVKSGARPVLAGRNAEAVGALAAQLGCEARAFALTDAATIAPHLQGVSAVLNCAGPFMHTVRPLLGACLASRCHYLDITGEIDVFEYVHAQDAALKKAGITALPGVGFDVVPSDCLAALLHRRLPSATHLALGFVTPGGKLSPGTAKTMTEKLGHGGKVRRGGAIVDVPMTYKTRLIDFNGRPLQAVTIPWGDVATAYYSTGIPDIEVYLAVPPAQLRMMRLLERVRWLFRPQLCRDALQALIGVAVKGASDEERARSRVHLWGEVSDAAGRQAVARLTTPDGYSLTAATALAATQRVLDRTTPNGMLTPSTAFGADFITGFAGVTLKYED